jgi:hypothetical protein
MDPEVSALKEAMMQKLREGLDEITAKPQGTLEDMENATEKLKNKLGCELMERLIAIKKKNLNRD